MKKLRILAVMARYDYGKPELGDSFEYNTFFSYFIKQGYSVEFVDSQQNSKKFILALQSKLQKKSFDVVFAVPLSSEFSNTILNTINSYKKSAQFVAWMCDDKWRWESFGKHLAPHFDFVITTDPDAVQKYHSNGYQNVILSQWGFDETSFKKMTLKKDIDVLFIGGISPWREYVIEFLKQEGINVHVVGKGWRAGRITLAEMVKLYNRAKIVLNLSNSTQSHLPFLLRVKPFKDMGSVKASIANSFPGLVEYLISQKRKEDIKARFFEVIGTGSFLLSYSVDHLDAYLKDGYDYISYSSLNSLKEKIQYYLTHAQERERIARQGYQTAQKKHRYSHRFSEVFKNLGVK